jgi:hypothetical protein
MVQDGEPADTGLFGWKDWKAPRHPILERETKPHPTKDGHYDCGDHWAEQRPDKWAPITDSLNPVRYPKLSPSWTLWRQYGMTAPFTNFFNQASGILQTGAGKRCQSFELQAMECLEYYGLKQGMDACKDWYDDLMECRFKTKQQLRTKHMWSKRTYDNRLEYYQGKRDHVFEEPPKFHAYIEPRVRAEDYFGAQN